MLKQNGREVGRANTDSFGEWKIDKLAPGDYVVRVRARNVPEDAVANTPAVDQDFALVVSGALPPPG